MSNQRFGTVTTTANFQKAPNGGTKWEYRCDCGTIDWAWAEVLKRNPNFTCKQCRKKIIAAARLVHGGRYTAEYGVWQNMKTRCSNPHHKSFHSYGARGITVCERWNDFQNFIKDMGPRPPGLTIERIGNGGNYCPENCKWGTEEEQANNRRTNRFIEFQGERLSISQWSRKTGIHKSTIKQRLNRHLPPELIFSKTKVP